MVLAAEPVSPETVAKTVALPLLVIVLAEAVSVGDDVVTVVLLELLPAEFVAVTVKVYAVLILKPVTVHDVAVVEQLAVEPEPATV